MFLIVLLLIDNLTVLPYAYRRIRTAEFWVMRTPQTPYQQVCKHSVSIGGIEPPRETNQSSTISDPFDQLRHIDTSRAPHVM